jgi:cytochrome c556
MTGRVRHAAFAAAAVIVAAGPLLATPADSARSRIAGLRELGAAFKNVNDSLRGPAPQMMIVQISARQIVAAARDQYGWFPAGSGVESSAKTKAKAEIWSQPARFRAAQDAFATQVAAFDRVVKAGNPAAIRSATRSLGATCKGCHDTFRTPDP